MLITVGSSNGTLTVDVETGKVVKLKPVPKCDPGIWDIERFNLDEWKRFYGEESFPAQIDILDLGYWNQDGSYEAPAMDWRALIQNL